MAGSALVTNEETQDGQARERMGVSVSRATVRLQGGTTHEGGAVRYALLIYNNDKVRERTPEQQRRVNDGIAEILERPNVVGWLRLQDFESATTMRSDGGNSLLTDGPFVDSKDFLGGLVVVEAENLDGALAFADQVQAVRATGAIEIRPVRDGDLGSA
jgi:hypothetical protein